MAINKTQTTKVAVTNISAIVLTVQSSARSVRVFADRVVHVLVAPTGEASPDTSVPIAAFSAEIFAVPANSRVSAILADGEPSGSVWITEQ